jgi:hypothetical protein
MRPAREADLSPLASAEVKNPPPRLNGKALGTAYRRREAVEPGSLVGGFKRLPSRGLVTYCRLCDSLSCMPRVARAGD